MAIELKVPSVGESITEVVVGEWLKGEGDWVDVDESVVIIETDKATVELPAPAAGTLSKILKKEGEDAAVGDVIGHMEESEKPAGEKAAKGKKTAKAEGDEGGGDRSDDEKKPAAKKPEKKQGETPAADDQETHVMPSAQRLLAAAGLSAKDVEATGPGGRLLKEDVLRHQKQAENGSSKAEASRPAAAPASSGAREEEIVRMTTLRKRIAERLVASQQTAALLTTFNEVDMSAVMALRKRHQDAFVERHGIKLGFMSFFVKAVIEGLKEIPALNAEIRDGSIVYRNYFDIGVAVGGGKGLVVPVIRNAERLSFAGVEQAIADLAGRARDNKLTPDELQGGTFTISNGGIYGSMLSTPIVNPPQSGILGMHAIKDRPMAVNGEVVIRPVMFVALTYDHRLVDGREAVTFLVRVKDAIEEPARMLVEV